MRCNKAQEYVNQELDAVLPPDRTGKLRDHLDACHGCQQYRTDMLLGQRLLAATEPVLPDNFDWKLQLKLKQTLTQAVGEVQYPWSEKTTDRWLWLRNFGAATAVGLAAVLALAMVFGPVDSVPTKATPTSRLAAADESVTPLIATSDRRSLFQQGSGGLYRTGAPRLVSTYDSRGLVTAGSVVNSHWSGPSTADLQLISHLRRQNDQLRMQLNQYQRAAASLRAQLDTSTAEPLDLQQEQ